MVVTHVARSTGESVDPENTSVTLSRPGTTSGMARLPAFLLAPVFLVSCAPNAVAPQPQLADSVADQGHQALAPTHERPRLSPPPGLLAWPSEVRVVAPSSSSRPEAEPEAAEGPTSQPLACGLHNPMPGGFAAGYQADTGLDLAGMNQPVFALAAGYVDYAEEGHTAWRSPGDDDRAIRIELDEPLHTAAGRVTHVWYAHLAELAFTQAEGATSRRRVAAGQLLGTSGRANGMYHLHLGLLLDHDTTQNGGTFLLEDQVRAVLCNLRHKSRLPAH
jgi:murein DD-endopeptidase MepM/ murein hydrolase activator NlpD